MDKKKTSSSKNDKLLKNITDDYLAKYEAASFDDFVTECHKAVENFMAGISYELDPYETLKLIAASSIFGEPQYYINGKSATMTSLDNRFRRNRDSFRINDVANLITLDLFDSFLDQRTSNIMETVIDNSLRFNYENTLDFAVTLRNDFSMRLNPQVIMVRAAIMTEERTAFTKEHPGAFHEINMKVMKRADDVISQIAYYISLKESKKSIPGILKRSWAKKIESLSRYELYKYKNADLGLIDAIRICHAHNDDIDELMRTGTLVMAKEDHTWESLRASGMDWNKITDTIRMNHMALLRNLRGIFSEIDDIEKCDELLKLLKNGVLGGKQFPFRYMSAYNAVLKASDSVNDIAREKILKALENCVDISCANLPHLPGNNAFLSDNSGSAWGACPSEYGTVTVAEIGNLSSVIGAVNSDSGTVMVFGDRLIKFPVDGGKDILSLSRDISKTGRKEVGMSTENGIWLFLEEAIRNRIVYDNIFIYSDMQAGHGDLYGTKEQVKVYRELGCYVKYSYIDVNKLIVIYRELVNPKVNVYCIQTAGYTNVLVPENGYRTSILYGWTGKELVYADAINRFWDEFDSKQA